MPHRLFSGRLVILGVGECLTYNDINKAGSGTKISVADLETLRGEYLTRSLPYLGKEPLQHDQARAIWDNLVKEYGNVSLLPEETIQNIGWVSAGIPPEDFQYMSLAETDTLMTMGEYHGLNTSQLAALAEAVRCAWWFKEPEDYTQFDLIFLGHILCAFNKTDVERIHADSYRKAAEKLSSLKDCPRDVLQALASLASNRAGFGPPSAWTARKIEFIGCVIAGLSPKDIGSIPEEAMDGLTEEAISCIPPDTLKAMSVSQLSMLRAHVIDQLSPEQRDVLSSEQQHALKKKSQDIRILGNSRGCLTRRKICLIIETTITIFIMQWFWM